MHLKFFDSYNCLEVMDGKLILPSPPASLTIPINLLISKIERKFQLDKLLSIYAEKLLYLKFFDSYNSLEVMGLKLIFNPPPASLTIPISLLISKIERKF